MKVLQRESKPGTEQEQKAVQYVAAEVSIFETSDGYVLEAEMPGVNKSGLEITLEGNELTITGRRQVHSGRRAADARIPSGGFPARV